MKVIFTNILIYLTSIILFFIGSNALSQTLTQADSLLIAINKMPDDTNKVNSLNDLVWKTKLSDSKKADSLGNISYNLAQKLSFEKGIAYATKNLAAVHYYQSDYDKALYLYEKSLESFQNIKDKKGIAIAYRNIANIYHQKGNWKQALDYYFKSLALREEINDKKGIAAVYNAIGLVYTASEQEEEDVALKYYKKALLIQEELSNDYGVATSLLYIGNTFFSKYNTIKNEKIADSTSSKYDIIQDKKIADSAIFYLLKSRDISERINELRFIATIDDLIGGIYLLQNKLEDAYKYFTNSLTIKNELGNKFGIAGSMGSLGNYHKIKKQYSKAETYFSKANQLSIDIGAKSLEKNFSLELAYIYYLTKKFKKSSEYFERHLILKDSLMNDEKTKEMTQLAMQYEFDKKQRIQELEKQKREALQQARIQRQKTITGFFITGFLLMILLAIAIFRGYRNKKKANKLLEEKNNEILNKNVLLNQQKEEIEAQRDEIEIQRDFVIKQKDEIAQQNKHITDSIIYAQRIQQAVLPPEDFFNKILLEYFILFKPRDIVSGDYYWATEKNGKIILVAADCTGHGVPGAFMSLLGVSYLNEIVNKINTRKGEEIHANEILNHLRSAIKTSLRQTGKFHEAKDGMDMALCVIDTKEMKMQYAGANNPLLLLRNNELIKYNADRMPVGIHYRGEKPFTNNEIDIKKGDAIYIYSDGYVDQFGGEKGRKFMNKRFRDLIHDNHKKPMTEQKEIFETTIAEWQKSPNDRGERFKQIDDILVIAFRI